MMIIGCDFHIRYQQVAMLDLSTCEMLERRLEHESGEARAFYAALSGRVAEPLISPASPRKRVPHPSFCEGWEFGRLA
jgi:hypothetical protein